MGAILLPMSDKLVKKAEVAEFFSVSVRTVDNWITRRVIPFIRVTPKTIRFDLDEVRNAINRNGLQREIR